MEIVAFWHCFTFGYTFGLFSVKDCVCVCVCVCGGGLCLCVCVSVGGVCVCVVWM